MVQGSLGPRQRALTSCPRPMKAAEKALLLQTLAVQVGL